jgi:hypothetical protein
MREKKYLSPFSLYTALLNFNGERLININAFNGEPEAVKITQSLNIRIESTSFKFNTRVNKYMQDTEIAPGLDNNPNIFANFIIFHNGNNHYTNVYDVI